MTKLQAIIVAILIYIFGIFSHCIFTNNKKTEIVDKHSGENKVYDSILNSINNKLKVSDQNYSDLLIRISKTDSILKTIDSKDNEVKTVFHRSNHAHFNDSVLRANNLLNR